MASQGTDGPASFLTRIFRLCRTNPTIAFAFYIPFSVVVVVGCIPQLFQIVNEVQTVQVVRYEPMKSILEMDADGDGEISETEYILFNLIARKEVDPIMVETLRTQFKALDVDGGGSLTADDFPHNVCLRRTTWINGNQISSVDFEVVPSEQGLKEYKAVGDMKDHQKLLDAMHARAPAPAADKPVAVVATVVANGLVMPSAYMPTVARVAEVDVDAMIAGGGAGGGGGGGGSRDGSGVGAQQTGPASNTSPLHQTRSLDQSTGAHHDLSTTDLAQAEDVIDKKFYV